ncbi:MAG: hypothetical protein E6I80_12635 [Chloroflexi bacterium]|nr:MAG: hypothetical protein E6I80_12635 [Chloroflexota bacterium]
MLRGLYRFYLYSVFIAMLLFATTGVIQLLTVLFQNIFKEPYNTPGAASLVQAVVFGVVALVIATLFGGLHYWLIRRDMQNDPMAGNSAVRTFFLNAVELVILPWAVISGASSISALGQPLFAGISSNLAFTIAFLALWVLLEWERHRAQASYGAAIVFQRLHLYGAQLILLIIFTFSWLQTVGQLMDSIIFGGAGAASQCSGNIGCQAPSTAMLIANTASLLWIALFWLGYGWLSRNDTASMLRRVFHLISMGYGVIAVLVGVYRGAALIMLSIFKVPIAAYSISGPFAAYDVISPLSLGLLVAAVYLFWLRDAALKHPAEKVSILLTGLALVAALPGVAFWFGCGFLLLNIVELISPSNTALTAEIWASAIAYVVAGIAYVPLGLLLRGRSKREMFFAPLRGFTFALLGGGILAAAIGGATALYAYVTAALGSPLENWMYIAHVGIAAFAVGVLIVAIYLWTSIREGFFSGAKRQVAAETAPAETAAAGEAQPSIPVTTLAEVTAPPIVQAEQAGQVGQVATMAAVTQSIGVIVDELLAGKISRDEAVSRIEKVAK